MWNFQSQFAEATDFEKETKPSILASEAVDLEIEALNQEYDMVPTVEPIIKIPEENMGPRVEDRLPKVSTSLEAK